MPLQIFSFCVLLSETQYDIVNNAVSGLDVDKLDYFIRDKKNTVDPGAKGEVGTYVFRVCKFLQDIRTMHRVLHTLTMKMIEYVNIIVIKCKHISHLQVIQRILSMATVAENMSYLARDEKVGARGGIGTGKEELQRIILP